MPSVGIILLAAGRSSRMGRSKQTLLYEGKTLLARAIETALASEGRPVCVVTGANAAEIAPIAKNYSVEIVPNPDWGEGMNSSIRAGIVALRSASEPLDAAVVMACDQPFLTPAILNALIYARRATGRPIAACAYAGTLGIPALFDISLFSELLALPAGIGARKLIVNRRAEDIAVVPFPQGAIDMDTPEDFAAIMPLQRSDCATE